MGDEKIKHTSFEWVRRVYLDGVFGASTGGDSVSGGANVGFSLFEIAGEGRSLSLDIGGFGITSIVGEPVGPVTVDSSKLGAYISLPGTSWEWLASQNYKSTLSSRFKLSLRGFGTINKPRGELEVEGQEDEVCDVYSRFNACSPDDPNSTTEEIKTSDIGSIDLHLEFSPLIWTYNFDKIPGGFSGFELAPFVFVAGKPTNYARSFTQEEKFGTEFGAGLRFALLIGGEDGRSDTGLNLTPLMDVAILGLAAFAIVPARELDVSSRGYAKAIIQVPGEDGHLNSEVPDDLREDVGLESQITGTLSQVLFLGSGAAITYLSAESEPYIAYPSAILGAGTGIYLMADGTPPAWHLLSGSLIGTSYRLDKEFKLEEYLLSGTQTGVSLVNLFMMASSIKKSNDGPHTLVQKDAWRTTGAVNNLGVGLSLGISPYSAFRKVGYGSLAATGVIGCTQEDYAECGLSLAMSLGLFITDMVLEDKDYRKPMFLPEVTSIQDTGGNMVPMLGISGQFGGPNQ